MMANTNESSSDIARDVSSFSSSSSLLVSVSMCAIVAVIRRDARDRGLKLVVDVNSRVVVFPYMWYLQSPVQGAQRAGNEASALCQAVQEMSSTNNAGIWRTSQNVRCGMA